MKYFEPIIPFDLLEIRHYNLNRLNPKNKNKNILALDTETLNGYCKLLADSTTAYIFPKNITDILKFMTEKRFYGSLNFFYNLNYDVNAIIKFLPDKNLKELYNGCYLLKYDSKTKQYIKKFQNSTTVYKDFVLFYIPKKLFSITYKNKKYNFYDVAQFYSHSLEFNAKKYLGLEKYIDIMDDGKKMDGEKLGTDINYWNINKNKIIEYCINDCILTQKLAELLHSLLHDNIGIYVEKYMSKASISKQYMRQHINLPNISKIPGSVLKYSFYTYSGGRFEIIKKGNVGKCTLVDINSAYPYHIRNLININNGKWIRVKNLHENAYYGYYKVKLFTKYNKISPIHKQLSNGTVIYPIMDSELYLTKNELLEYDKYINYEIITGWEYYPDKIEYIFKDFIDKLYEYKNNTDKNNFEYSLYKIIMNGGYGLFLEKHLDKETGKIITGKLFNPIYATEITSRTRIELFKMGMKFSNKLIAFATDSCLFSGKPDISISDKLGKWDYEGIPNSETIVLKSGLYKMGKKTKNRGIKKVDRLKTPYGYYDNVFDYIYKKPELTIYPITMNRPLTFIETLLHYKKYGHIDINNFIDMDYNIDINNDYKRMWNNEFQSGNEIFTKMIDSKPLIL